MDRLLRLPSPDLPLMPLALAMASRMRNGLPLRIVKVGAYAGHDGDYLRQFLEQEENVQAVLAEPDPVNFNNLTENLGEMPGVRLVRAAVGREEGPGVFHTVRTEGRWASSPLAGQLGSLTRDHLMRHGVLEEEILPIPVRVITLASLMSLGEMDSADMLVVDAEGSDHGIVMDALTMEEPPPLVCFEHRHMAEEEVETVFERLRSQRYRWTHDRFDTVALRFDGVDPTR
jgi:FkbM family methyltransferase